MCNCCAGAVEVISPAEGMLGLADTAEEDPAGSSLGWT